MKRITTILLVLCASLFSFAIIEYLPDAVPSQYQSHALLFGTIGFFAAIYLSFVFLSDFRRFFLLGLVILPILPYFESYLFPIGGDFLRIVPQFSIIFLIAAGLLIHPVPMKKSIINWFNLIWIALNTLVLFASKDLKLSVPAFCAGILGPSLFLFVLHNKILTSAEGFTLSLKSFISATAIYILFSVFLVLVISESVSFSSIFMNRFGSDLSLGYFSSNALPAYSAFGFPLLFWLIVNKVNLGKAYRVMIQAVFILIIFIIITLLSRGGIILSGFYVIGIVIYLIIKNGKQWLFRPGIILVFAVVASIILLFMSNTEYTSYLNDRFYNDQSGFDGIKYNMLQNVRMLLWQTSFGVFEDNWLTGIGLGNIRSEMLGLTGFDLDSHNIFLDILAEQGVFIFIVFVAAVSVMFYWAFAKLPGITSEKREMQRFLFAGIFAFLFYSSITGGRIVTVGETVSGLALYFFFSSMAFQYYLLFESKEQPGLITYGNG